MVLSLLDWLAIASFLVLSLLVGLYFRKRASSSMASFFVGNRNMPWLVAGISMVATTFAADTPLAVTELVGKNGISGNWLWWSYLSGGMLTTFFFARLWRRSGVITEIELVELRYGGPTASFLRGFKAIYLGLFMNVLIIGWVNLAMITIITQFFGVSYEIAYAVVGGVMVLAAIYTALSGIWGVAVTDVIQFVVAMGGSIVLAIIVVNSPEVGGIAGMKAALPPETFSFFPKIVDDSGGSSAAQTLGISVAAFFAFVGMQWWASWYPGQEPGGGGYVAQRMMSTKTEKGAVYATLLFQIAHYCLRPWPWILVALSCLVIYPEMNPAFHPELGEGEFGKTYVLAMRDYLPPGLRGVLLASFLAAYLSTISTQLNWGAGYLVNDLYKRFLKPEESDKSYVDASRIATVFLLIAGLSVTQFMDSVSGVWTFIIECGAGLGLVLILRWYWWRVNAWSEITATIVPFIAYFTALYVLELEFPNRFFFTVGVTTLSWIVVTFLTPPEKDATLQRFCDQVKPDGAWKNFSNNKEQSTNHTTWLAVCWIAAVIMAYSVLFAFGKIIFQEWSEATAFGAAALVSGVVLVQALKRTSIWQ